jgi:hypothetical protein
VPLLPGQPAHPSLQLVAAHAYFCRCSVRRASAGRSYHWYAHLSLQLIDLHCFLLPGRCPCPAVAYPCKGRKASTLVTKTGSYK